MRYFLDTNMVIYCLKGNFPAIREHIRSHPAQSIVIPTVVLAEIEYGARKSKNYEQTIKKYKAFTDVFQVESFDEDCVQAYGRIRAQLEAKGTPIGPNDLLIAAIAAGKDGVLVTHNTKEFSRVSGLSIVDWTIEN